MLSRRGALLIRGPSCGSVSPRVGPGSAAHRRRGAAARPGHETQCRACPRARLRFFPSNPSPLLFPLFYPRHLKSGRHQNPELGKATCPCRSKSEGGSALPKNRPSGKSVSSPASKNFLLCLSGKSSLQDRAIPSHLRGVSRSSRTRDGMRWTRQRFAREMVAGLVERLVSDQRACGREMLQRTAKSCGPDAPTLASSLRMLGRPYRAQARYIR